MCESVDVADVVQEPMHIAMQFPRHVQGIFIIMPDISVEGVIAPGDHIVYAAGNDVQGKEQQ